jgi:uncharacterized small protein (DUF1192 family)
MLEDAAEPRRGRGEITKALAKEDLEIYGREELLERIDLLKQEIARIEAQLERKHSGRAAADALFTIKER